MTAEISPSEQARVPVCSEFLRRDNALDHRDCTEAMKDLLPEKIRLHSSSFYSIIFKKGQMEDEDDGPWVDKGKQEHCATSHRRRWWSCAVN